ncbi:hydrophobic surface binding protein A-domain-containing protein [Boeremia exigua]|uniref:hydrophobic surface binding protein A-domain-containing protein n=1 Tax=Boeremia exigua TaxID=749465 RepID=UPI001E8DD633|nr:hydrophobic surface binding protein A-domain-containing protein [Boeremia exigua]KAH6629008.1 hydrophobic surface binding protein A-domain-containing protein [Boeremia exigua]
MRLLTFLPLLPAALALALPQSFLPTGQTVVQDIINIHNAVLELDATVAAYNGAPFPTSLVAGTPVLLGVAKIHSVNRAGFRHALAAAPFSVPDSNDVINTVTATVNKSIPAATQRLKEKLPAFREGALVPIVIASLALLLSDHDSFSAATLAKVDPGVGEAKIKEGADGVANIHNAIQDAIVFYTVNAV